MPVLRAVDAKKLEKRNFYPTLLHTALESKTKLRLNKAWINAGLAWEECTSLSSNSGSGTASGQCSETKHSYYVKVPLQCFERDCMMTAIDSKSLSEKGLCSLVFICKILLLQVTVGRCTHQLWKLQMVQPQVEWKWLCVSASYACCYQEFGGSWRCEGVWALFIVLTHLGVVHTMCFIRRMRFLIKWSLYPHFHCLHKNQRTVWKVSRARGSD